MMDDNFLVILAELMCKKVQFCKSAQDVGGTGFLSKYFTVFVLRICLWRGRSDAGRRDAIPGAGDGFLLALTFSGLREALFFVLLRKGAFGRFSGAESRR